MAAPSTIRTAPPRFAIVVMGVSGCGKSTLAEALAAELGCPALEGDDFHGPANVAKMRAGQPLDDADRWPWLGRLGRAIGSAIDDGGMVVAACSALKRSYRERLQLVARMPILFVLLDGSREELATRLAARTWHYMPSSLLDSQLATLERPGADEHALTLPCAWPVERLRDAVLDRVRGNVAA